MQVLDCPGYTCHRWGRRRMECFVKEEKQGYQYLQSQRLPGCSRSCQCRAYRLLLAKTRCEKVSMYIR